MTNKTKDRIGGVIDRLTYIDDIDQKRRKCCFYHLSWKRISILLHLHMKIVLYSFVLSRIF